jgi:lipopolysaccharide/colanic/teichoic acid biosynthesis glycosyltransferase
MQTDPNGSATARRAPEIAVDHLVPLSIASPRSTPLTNSEVVLPPAPDDRHSDPVLCEIPHWKRILDLNCILLALPLWLTAMALVSAWILLLSPGPILYRQERVGHKGRRFVLLKFRTMRVNAETKSHEGYFETLTQTDCPMTKLDICDSRLIRGGRVLRALGLDELPQIFNVVRGEMSLVGPRPCTPHEFERYRPAQKKRVNAPPGLTGYWQVNGKNKTTFNQMISMDIYYAKHMSISLDLGIMLKTIPAIGTQVGEALTRTTSGRLIKLRPYLFTDNPAQGISQSEMHKETTKNT